MNVGARNNSLAAGDNKLLSNYTLPDGVIRRRGLMHTNIKIIEIF